MSGQTRLAATMVRVDGASSMKRSSECSASVDSSVCRSSMTSSVRSGKPCSSAVRASSTVSQPPRMPGTAARSAWSRCRSIRTGSRSQPSARYQATGPGAAAANRARRVDLPAPAGAMTSVSRCSHAWSRMASRRAMGSAREPGSAPARARRTPTRPSRRHSLRRAVAQSSSRKSTERPRGDADRPAVTRTSDASRRCLPRPESYDDWTVTVGARTSALSRSYPRSGHVSPAMAVPEACDLRPWAGGVVHIAPWASRISP